MAPINPLLKALRIVVNGVDCTAAADGDQWVQLNTPKISTDGLFPCTGTLTLLPVAGFPASFFDPRRNRSQWRRGVSVEIEIQRVTDLALIREFTGYVLKRPATPANESGRLIVSIGDELAYRDIDQPAEDRAGVKLGSSRSRTAIINSIANGSGWAGSWQGQISEYPLNYPAPKYQGSFVKQAGAIAASACYGLYCDRFGDIQAVKLERSPVSAPLFERSFADTFLEATDGSDEPAAKVQAIASGRSIEASERSLFEVVEQQGVILLSNGRPRDYVQKRTTISQEWSPSYKTLTKTTTVEVPISGENERIYLVLKNITVETKQFSAGIDGKLRTRTTEVLTGPEFTGIAGQRVPIVTAKEVEDWSYTGEVPATKKTDVYTLLDGDEILSRSDSVAWVELSGGVWQKIESTYKPFILEDGSVIDAGDTNVFIGIQYRPSEPERHIPTHSSQEISYQGIACFGGVADDTDEPEIYEFDYGVSNTQAERLAELHGAILIGRDSGWTCSMEYGAEWAGWSPASAARITLPNGDIGLFLIDGVSRNFSRAIAMVTFGCVELGTVGSVDISPTPGVILGNAPASPPLSTITPLSPPYDVVISSEHTADAAFIGQVLLNSSQPGPEVFAADAAFIGGDPQGDSYAIHSADAAFIGSE